MTIDTSMAAVTRHTKRTQAAASIFKPSNGHINVLVKRAKLSCEMLVIIAAERDAAVAALTQSRAETAAAYALGLHDAADQCVFYASGLVPSDAQYWMSTTLPDSIRALKTPDQTAALDAVKAEAKADGMEEAAKLCENVRNFRTERGDEIGYDNIATGAQDCIEIILAAIPKGGAE